MPDISHEFVCVGCADRSGPCREFETAQHWALGHSGRNPSHTTYRETIHRYWQTAMVD
ncbi:hypothetical protein [Streptomyces orinoci]|uniref:DUF7848 domain-containing protein n=1 Tax=Streptomyces orinoci TaxID=67339 RepID=A0ABV3K7Z7_STRON|nr:hypothetical protein [Streptomyces orinoci]